MKAGAARKPVALCCAPLLALVSTSCASNDAATESADVETLQATTEPAPVATSAPLATATPRPAPTPVPIPSPTPEFGPTGRPSSAGEVHVLTAKPEISRPTVYDKANGAPVPVRYEYLNGRVDENYRWFVNPTYFGNPLAMMVVTGEPGDELGRGADPDPARDVRLGEDRGLHLVELELLRASRYRDQHAQGVGRRRGHRRFGRGSDGRHGTRRLPSPPPSSTRSCPGQAAPTARGC